MTKYIPGICPVCRQFPVKEVSLVTVGEPIYRHQDGYYTKESEVEVNWDSKKPKCQVAEDMPAPFVNLACQEGHEWIAEKKDES